MLKWYAELYKMSEEQVTRKALNRMKIITVLALPAPPLLILDTFGIFTDMSGGIKFAIMAIPLAAFFIVCFSKFANRFLMPNKYLDEWEIARKQQAMAFSYQCLIYTFMTAMIFFMFLNAAGNRGLVDIGPMNYAEFAMVLLGVFTLLLYIVHIYLLLTVKPIDEVQSRESLTAKN